MTRRGSDETFIAGAFRRAATGSCRWAGRDAARLDRICARPARRIPTFYVLPVAAVNGLLVLGTLDIVNSRDQLDTTTERCWAIRRTATAAPRNSYIQNMRARLQGGTDVGQLEDIYADQ